MKPIQNFNLLVDNRQICNILITFLSLLLMFLLSLVRLPGMKILGIGPNWLVIWLVAWSVSHSRFRALLGATCLALILDSLTSSYPTHLPGFLSVAWFATAKNMNPRNIITIMLGIFGLVLFTEATMALQYLIFGLSFFNELWVNYQKIGISSALLTSLWSPFIYYPLSLWWKSYNNFKKFD